MTWNRNKIDKKKEKKYEKFKINGCGGNAPQ